MKIDKKKPTIGLGILSWRSHKTLEKSLQSYEKIGLKDFFDQATIVFQEISDDDIVLANKYGYSYIGKEKNLGIQYGHQLIYENVKTDYIVVLENDNPVVEERDITFHRLQQALYLLDEGKIDVMRLRHRWEFGEGFSLEKYTKFYDVQQYHEKFRDKKESKSRLKSFYKYLKRFFRPGKAQRIAGYGLYFEKFPEKVFPQFVRKIDDEVYVVSSRIMTWTNQSVFLQREFYGRLLEYAVEHPSSRTANGFQDFEKSLNSKWWREQNFQIGVGEGIFTHKRLDDSWRNTHHAYNEEISEN